MTGAELETTGIDDESYNGSLSIGRRQFILDACLRQSHVDLHKKKTIASKVVGEFS